MSATSESIHHFLTSLPLLQIFGICLRKPLPSSPAAMVARAFQICGFRPPKARNVHQWRRMSPSPAKLVTFRGHFLGSPLPPSLSVKFRPISRTTRAVGGSDQVGGNGNDRANSFKSAEGLNWTKPLLRFVGANFLPLALVSGVALGLANPTLGCLAHKYSLSKYSTFAIFVISGLVLRSDEISSAAEAWPAGMFGLASILLFSPFLSKLILQLHLSAQEFVTGLAIFCCMPTTLSSGVTLTQLVRGNSSLALAMTVLSNLLGILFVPFSLSNFIGQGAGVSIPTAPLFKSLAFTLLVPLILGKVFRDSFSSVAQYVDGNQRSFSIISAILLSLVPWMQVSRSRSLLLTVKPAFFLAAIFMGILLHLILLAINMLALNSLSVISGSNKSVFAKKENARAVIIVASQKTLPVMVAVVEQLGGALGQSGLLVLPCVAAHIIQIIIDSFLVSFWLQKDQASTASTS